MYIYYYIYIIIYIYPLVVKHGLLENPLVTSMILQFIETSIYFGDQNHDVTMFSRGNNHGFGDFKNAVALQGYLAMLRCWDAAGAQHPQT